MKCGAAFSLHTSDVSLVLKVAIITTGPRKHITDKFTQEWFQWSCNC
jgi:hypothetical protein